MVVVVVFAVLGLTGWMFLSSPMFKPTLATVSIAALDRPAEQAVTIAPNAAVGFGMRSERFSYSGPDYVVIRVELLREGAVVGAMRCRAYELEGSAGGGSDVTMYNSDCQMRAPAWGADRVRVTASQEGAGSLTMRGVTVPMYTP